MSRFKSWLSRLETVLRWIGYISGLLTLAGIVSEGLKGFTPKAIAPFTNFLAANYLLFWLGFLTLLSFSTLIWTKVLHRRLSGGFSDNFTQNLTINWDFVGDWTVTPEGWLLITNSEIGGLTKTGALWENYILQFEAKILAECLGVIVRGIDLNNYYMFQIRRDRIRPHRRITFPIETIESGKPPHDLNAPASIQFRPVGYAVKWEAPRDLAVNLDQPLSDWFAVSIRVHGEAASIQINGKLVFHAESFLKNPTGKIGFRNSGSEKALIRKVKVTPLT